MDYNDNVKPEIEDEGLKCIQLQMREPFLIASRDHPEFFIEDNYPSKGRVRMITILPEFRGRGILHVIFDGFEKIAA